MGYTVTITELSSDVNIISTEYPVQIYYDSVTTQGNVGPTGAKGDTGATGATGPQGIQGIQGIQGPTGATGATGATGSQGIQGNVGPQGIQGNVGPQGPQGNVGATGATGSQGIQGIQGIQGETGATGAQGIQGIQGNVGATGATGPQGIQGNTGAQGAGLTILGTVSNVASLPASGSIGNAYIIATTAAEPEAGNLYAWSATTNTWADVGQIVGPQGPQGIQGIQGNVGATGAQGPQGIQGNTGATGSQGIQGETGPQGIQGNVGATGATGAQGIQGNVGNTGSQGIQGIQGNTGATGSQGIQGIQGIQGNIGLTGNTGASGSPGILMEFSANTTIADPGINNVNNLPRFRFNSLSGYNDITQIAFTDYFGGSGTGANVWFETWALSNNTIKGSIYIRNAETGGEYGTGIYLLSNIAKFGTSPNSYFVANVSWAGGTFGGVSGGEIKAIAFSAYGNIGATGSQGIQGNVGATGATGATGAQGIQGNVGATGATGPQRIQGNVGATGPQGEQGIQGNIGATGATGPQGIQGNVGATGATGPQGIQGNVGATGATGANGANGTDGVSVTTANVTAGNLLITLSNTTVINAGTVTGGGGASNYGDSNVAAYLPTYTGNIANVRLGVSGVLTFADGTTQTTAGGGSGIANVSVDTTPRLGGNLDPNGFSITANIAHTASDFGPDFQRSKAVFRFENTDTRENLASSITIVGKGKNMRFGVLGNDPTIVGFGLAPGTNFIEGTAGVNSDLYFFNYGNIYSGIGTNITNRGVEITGYQDNVGTTRSLYINGVDVGGGAVQNYALDNTTHANVTLESNSTLRQVRILDQLFIANAFPSASGNIVLKNGSDETLGYDQHVLSLSGNINITSTGTFQVRSAGKQAQVIIKTNGYNITFEDSFFKLRNNIKNISSMEVAKLTFTFVQNEAEIGSHALVDVDDYTANDPATPGSTLGKVGGFSLGYLEMPQVTAGNVTLALADSGKHYYSTSSAPLTVTIPTEGNVIFPIGTVITMVNRGTANVIIDPSATVNLYLAGNTTSAGRTITSYGVATLLKVESSVWMINGTGVV
jgi:hypothetical protein